MLIFALMYDGEVDAGRGLVEPVRRFGEACGEHIGAAYGATSLLWRMALGKAQIAAARHTRPRLAAGTRRPGGTAHPDPGRPR